MSSYMLTALDNLHLRILNQKKAGAYTHNQFEVEVTFLPFSEFKDMPEGGKLYLIGLMAGDPQPLTRTAATTREVPVQLGFHARVEASNQAQVRKYVALMEELMDTARYMSNWSKNEPMRDEDSQLPYTFLGLREGIFESYFSAYFRFTLPPEPSTDT